MFRIIFSKLFKVIIPTSFLFGSSINFLIVWLIWRLITAFLPNHVFHFGDDGLYSLYQRCVLFFFEFCTGTKIFLYGDAKKISKKKENVILLCNHQCSMDWMVADMLAVRQGTIGHIRYILKNSLRYFPIYGLYFRMHKCIYVKRQGQFQKNQAEQQLREIRDAEIPFWMIVFPEGTRYNVSQIKTIEKSKQFAKDRGLDELYYVLTPRFKAVQQCVLNLPTPVLYDVTIAYGNTIGKDGKRKQAPSLINFLNGHHKEIHIHLERIEYSKIPKDDDNLQIWLHERFKIKDRMLKQYYTEKPILTNGGEESKLSLKEIFPSFLFFFILYLPFVTSLRGILFYFQFGLISSILSILWMAVTA